MKYLDRKPSEYIADFKDFCKDWNLDENDDNSIEKYINEFTKWHIMFKGIGYVQMEAMELEDVLLNKERYSLEEGKNKEENNEETLDEILERAISEEKDAINTYDDILEKVDNKDLEDMIKEIKSDEEEHQKLLEHYLETGEALADDELDKLEKEKKTENKKLIESHLDDYSSEKRYQVTYISKDGEEDKVTYKPTKNTNIAGVQKELGNKYKDFFKLKDIQEIEGEVENMKNEDLDLLDSEELIEKDTLTEATSLSARDDNNTVIVNKNQYGYNTIAIIIDDTNKRFQLVTGQSLPTGKYRKASKKAIRQKAEDLKTQGYEEIKGANSLTENKEEAVTTQKGTFEKEELDAMEQEMKDAFKDYWNSRISLEDLEAVKEKLGKYLTNAQITNCQTEASLEDKKVTESKSPLFRFKNGEINRGEFDEIADKESPEYKFMNHMIDWAEYDKLADHNSADYKYLNNEINFGEYAKLNENVENKTEAFSDSEERDFVRYGNCIAKQDYADRDVVGYIFFENEEDYEKGITGDYQEFSKPFEREDIINHMKDIFSSNNEEEIYYLQDRILDYEKHGIGTKKEYEKNLDRLQQLQSGDMSENKKITEDTERDDVTEYVISFEDMNDDEYFEDKEEADKRFEELKSNKELNKVHQYYRKDWNWDEESESYIEGYVEVFYTNGDLVEESFEDELADAKADSIEKGLYTESDERGYLHIEFTDGSNPYIKFVDNKKELDAEIKKWSKEFNIETVKDMGSKLFVKATPKRKEPDLFDLDELDESEKLIEGASNFEELKNQIIDAYHSVLPNCGCTVEKGALGKDTFFVTFYLAKDNSEFPNKIAQNDLFNISFFITPDTRDINLDKQLPETFNLEVNGNTILTKPDNQYMAYGSVRVPLRKVSGSPDKIVQAITKYAQKTKEVLEKLVNDDKIPEDRKELVISKL